MSKWLASTIMILAAFILLSLVKYFMGFEDAVLMGLAIILADVAILDIRQSDPSYFRKKTKNHGEG